MSKEEKLILRDKYIKADSLIDILSKLLGNNNDMDLDEMNYWLRDIINFYKSQGVKLSESDFLCNGEESNIIKKYIYLFFKNIDNLDNNYKFNELIFSMPEPAIIPSKENNQSEAENQNNPILKYVIRAVKSIHVRNNNVISKFLDVINNYLSSIGINKVSFDNIDKIKLEINEKIDTLDDEIFKEEELEQEKKEQEKFNRRLCMMITNGEYNNMSKEEQENISNHLQEICLMIVKLRIFRDVSEQYKEYSEVKDYKKLLDIVKGKKISIEYLKERIDKLESKSYSIIRNKILLRLYKKMGILECELEEILGNYFVNFYNMFNMDKLSNEYNISGLKDITKLFGEFDFEMLPPTVDKINKKLAEKYNGVVIPEFSSEMFNEISIMAIQYLNKDNLEFSKMYTRKK